MIEILVSDVGNVLLPFDTEPAWRRMLAGCGMAEEGWEAARARFRIVLAESGLGVGRIGAEAFHAQVVQSVGLRLSFAEFCEAWSDIFWEDAAVIELIRRAPVAERYLLSNTNAIHWEWIRRRYPHLLAGFDRVIVSHECGLAKPDAAVFEHVLTVSGRPPEAHLFIDDLAANVEAARRLGFDGIVHTDAAALREALAERGLA